jgi:transcriptional regulator with XRE-family HTH domain
METTHCENDASSVSAVLNAGGRRLRALRREAEMSQEELADAAGVTAKYVSQVENGHANPSLEVLHALSEKGLKIPLAAFFAYDTRGRRAHDEIREVQVLVASRPKSERRRLLHVLRALVEPLDE